MKSKWFKWGFILVLGGSAWFLSQNKGTSPDPALENSPKANAPLPATIAAEADLVAKGKAKAVIIIPEGANAVVRYAAEELQEHIKLATGVSLAIETEGSSLTGLNRIYLGPCKASAEEGLNASTLVANTTLEKTTPNALFLLGGDGTAKPPYEDNGGMGTLFAVYNWLEKQLDVKWIWPGDDGILWKKTDHLTAGKVGETKAAPRLIHSRLRLNGAPVEMGSEWTHRFLLLNRQWLLRHRYSRAQNFDYGHGFTKYWGLYGEQHPEYFARRPDGVRAPHSSSDHLVQMCVSSPALHRKIIENWLIQRENDPSKPWINGIENDRRVTDPACTCEECTQWDGTPVAETGGDEWLIGSEKKTNEAPTAPKVSLSTRYARFWLSLQKEGQKHDPNATVIGYAYADYAKPPEGVQLNSNIIVGIVPPLSFPLSERDREEFRKQWDGWAATGARLFLRPNFTLVGYCMPYIYAKEFATEYQRIAANGLIATDFDSLLGMWGVQGPNTYTFGRLNTTPEASPDAVLAEFYSAFGPAAQEVKAYFDYWEQITLRRDSHFRKTQPGGWAIISTSGDLIYTPETFEEGHRLLQNAAAAAAESPKELARVETLSQWLEHARLSMKTLAAHRTTKAAPQSVELKNAFLEAKQELDQFRDEHEKLFAATNRPVYLEKLETWAGWRKPVK